ncbi:sensor histidine kinase [Paractinoplanes abujensis]|uniref:histidine kinase n=1 Tax=Paractinoplanes abujensis TaxID=882441 RepID=A0A7W7CLS5_9ACTN|nr:histidine kinase [Actinoplanes abujensis]MBB4690912.1 signal transduction histidine kinase [Actinoplanes abujensis]
MKALIDVGIGVAGALVGAVTVVLGAPSGQPVAQWVLVEASVVALVLIRRLPLLLLGLEVVLIVATDIVLPYESHVAPLAAGLALGAVAYRHSGWVTTVGWAALYGSVVFTVGRHDLGLLSGVNGVLRLCSIAAAVGAPVAFGCWLAGLRKVAAQERERAVAEREAARMGERARISNDLHDLVAHHVSAIAMRAGSARYAARNGSAPAAERLEESATALDAIHTSAGQALVDLRGMLHVLRDPGGADPLIDPEQMITDAVERSRSNGLDVRADVDVRLALVPLALRVTAARVVQEALTNALKHAPGSSVVVALHKDAREIQIEVTNTMPDKSDNALPSSGHGLAGMRERVEILGGTFEAGPRDGGWRVAVTVELP